MKLAILSALVLTFAPLASAETTPAFSEILKALPATEKQVPLFNGKDLTGWEGMPGIWSIT